MHRIMGDFFLKVFNLYMGVKCSQYVLCRNNLCLLKVAVVIEDLPV